MLSPSWELILQNTFHFNSLLSQLLSSVNFNMKIFSELRIVESCSKKKANQKPQKVDALGFKVVYFVVVFF